MLLKISDSNFKRVQISFNQWKQLLKTCINYHVGYSKVCTFTCIFQYICFKKTNEKKAGFRTLWPHVYYLIVELQTKFQSFFFSICCLKKKKSQSLLYTLYINQHGDVLHNDSICEINSELLYTFIFRYFLCIKLYNIFL